jgi:hypothetical protein
MNIEDIRSTFEEDCYIEKVSLDQESLKIPYLHSKWSNIFFDELRELKILESRLKILKLKKFHYYTGKAPDEEYIQHPLDHKVLKQDLEMYLDADIDLNSLSLKVAEQKAKCELIERFLKEISQRNWSIRNAIEFLKFKNGIL